MYSNTFKSSITIPRVDFQFSVTLAALTHTDYRKQMRMSVKEGQSWGRTTLLMDIVIKGFTTKKKRIGNLELTSYLLPLANKTSFF